MGESFNSFSDYTTANSVTNDLSDEKLDINKPFSFIEFLNYSRVFDEEVENFKKYENYIKSWNNISYNNNINFEKDVKDQYINLFKEISLKYSTPEERRYLQTINFNNNENLTIAIPFYSKKIREICLYFKEKRDTFQKGLREVKDKGSTLSVKNFVKDKIIDLFQGDDSTIPVTSTLALSVLQVNIEVEIEESYDTFNDYYDLDPDKLSDFYNSTLDRKKYYTSNSNKIEGDSFIDLDKSIIKIINDKNIKLEELGNFSPVINVNEVDESYLESTDYIDYKKGDRDKLNFLFEAELVKKLIGTDYYFLSTNSENKFLSGVLFEGDNKVNNLLNINYASTLTVPSTSNKFEREVGGFYKPTSFSILKMKGDYTTSLKHDLSANTLYVFPDINSFGNITNLSKVKRDHPFEFNLNKDSVFKNESSSVSQKNVKSEFFDSNFYSYNTFEQFRNTNNLLSTFDTPYSFNHNYGIINKVEIDIYGNKFVEYLTDTSDIQQLKKDSIVSNKQSFVGSNTLSTFDRPTDKLSFFDKKIANKNVFVQNISTNSYLPLSSSFNNLFDKYTGNIQLHQELLSAVRNINIYDDVFTIDTDSFTLIDSFKYNGNFNQSTDIPLTVPVVLTDNTFTGVSNDMVVDNNIYKVTINTIPNSRLASNPGLSGIKNDNNYLFFYEFFSYDLDKKIEFPIINRRKTALNVFTSLFNLSALDIVPKRLRNLSLNYSSKLNVFNLIAQYNDLNENVYLHNILYKLFNNRLEILDNSIFRPENYYRTYSFFTSSFSGSDDGYYSTSLSGRIFQDFEKGILFL